MFDWIPLIGDWSSWAQTLFLIAAPLALLIPAYVFYYQAHYVWKSKNKSSIWKPHWASTPAYLTIWIAWAIAAIAGLLVGVSLMLEAVGAMSFVEAAMFIFIVFIAGFLVSVGSLGVSTHRLHENETSDTDKIPLKAVALIAFAFFGIVAAGATLTALVLIPIGGLAVIGSVPFPAQGGGEFSFGIMSLIVTSIIFAWVVASTVWN